MYITLAKLLHLIRIEKALISDRLRVSKASPKFRIGSIHNFTVIYS